MANANLTDPPEFIPQNDEGEGAPPPAAAKKAAAKQPVKAKEDEKEDDGLELKKKRIASVKFLDLRNAVETDPPELDFVLPALKKGSCGAIVATGGVGKTMLALQLAITVSSKFDMFNLEKLGWQCKTGKVVFFTGEDDLDVLQKRIHTMGRHMPPAAREEMYKNLEIASLVGLMAKVDDYQWMQFFAEKTKGARLVVFDTLRRFHNRDENDNGEMSELLGQLEALCLENDTTILFLHHTSKGGGGETTQHASRGASALSDNARWQVNLSTMTDSEAPKATHDGKPCLARKSWYVKLIFSKINYSAPIEDIWFEKEDGGALKRANIKVSKDKEKGQTTGVTRVKATY